MRTRRRLIALLCGAAHAWRRVHAIWPHKIPMNVSAVASADGPWFHYWRAIGGSTNTWDRMDDHQRARGPGGEIRSKGDPRRDVA